MKKVNEEDKLVEKVLEKTVEVNKKNLRSFGPKFEGFKLQFAKLPTA